MHFAFLRQVYAWNDPITAGDFITVLFPWLTLIFAIRAKLRTDQHQTLFGVALLANISLVICLVLTQSRGPIISAFLGNVLSFVAADRIAPECSREIRRCAVIGGAVLLLLLLASRVSNRFQGVDGSIVNRFQIWRSVPAIARLRPLSGLGAGEGAYIFSQWFEDNTISYIYNTVFNTYAEIALDYGMPLYYLFAFVNALFLTLPFFVRAARGEQFFPGLVGLCSFLSLSAYACCSATSTLIHRESLTCLWGLDMIVMGAYGVYNFARVRKFYWLSLSAVLPAVLATAMMLECTHFPMTVRVAENHEITISKMAHGVNERLRKAMVLVDRRVMGMNFGKVVRRELAESATYDELVVCDPRFELPNDALTWTGDLMLFGESGKVFEDWSKVGARRLIVVNPSYGPARIPIDRVFEVRLANFDMYAVAPLWREEQKHCKYRIVEAAKSACPD